MLGERGLRAPRYLVSIGVLLLLCERHKFFRKLCC